MQKQTIFCVLLVILLAASRANAQRGRLVGGRTEVKDVKKNKEIQDLGRFSVEEYNRSLLEDMPPSPLRGVVGDRSPNGRLVFMEVVAAQRQVVAGLKYYLKVAAMQNGVSRTFDAIVVVKPWEKAQSKKLLNFGPSHN